MTFELFAALVAIAIVLGHLKKYNDTRKEKAEAARQAVLQARDDERREKERAEQRAAAEAAQQRARLRPLFVGKSGTPVYGPVKIVSYLPRKLHNSPPQIAKVNEFENLTHVKPVVNEWLERGHYEIKVFGCTERYGGPPYVFAHIRRPDHWWDDVWPD